MDADTAQKPDFVRGSLKNRRSVQAGLFPADAPSPAKRDSEPRRNGFGAQCRRCGAWVPPDEGVLSKEEGRWIVEREGECPAQQDGPAQAQAPSEDEGVPGPVRNTVGGKTLYDGEYTIQTAGGHRTFKLSTQADDADFMPGRQLLAFLSGPDNEHDYKRFGHVISVRGEARAKVWSRWESNGSLVADVKQFFADPDAAVTSVACFACGRKLTVPASIHNGLGSDCAKRYL